MNEFEKYTKADLAKACTLAKGSACTPRSREVGWKMLGNLTAGDREPYLRQVRPDLFVVSHTLGELLAEADATVRVLNARMALGMPVGEKIAVLASDWLREDLVSAVEDICVIGDAWVGMHGHLNDHALDTYEGWKPVNLHVVPAGWDSVTGGAVADDCELAELLSMGEAPASTGLVDGRGKVHRKGGVEARVIEMLRAGCTAADVTAAVGWQPHTLRGFCSEGIRVRYGLVVRREKVGKGKGGYTIYKVD